MNIKHQGKLPWCFLIPGGQGITAIKSAIGGIIVTSMPLLGAMLLVIAFLAGRLVKLVTIRQIQIRAELRTEGWNSN